MARDPYRYFRVEARELLDGLGRGVLQLEKEATAELVAGLLRLAHTLKGAARVVKQPRIAEGAHAVEEILGPWREARDAVERGPIDQVLGHLDAMAADLAALDAPAPVTLPLADGAGPPGAREPARAPRLETAELDALVDGLTETGQQLGVLREALAELGRARRLSDLLVDKIAPEVGPGAYRLRSIAGELQDLVGASTRRLAGAFDRMERELGEARDAAEKLRLLPAETLFVPLERAARDAGRSIAREVDFEASGGEVRLEAAVLGLLQGALVQLVRNAVAHGIEPPSERIAAGKPAAGRVEIAVARRGNRVAFRCRDDGRGVDLEAVRRVARERGLLPAGATELAVADLLKLLLEGGLTTAGAVSEVAGRGIGLDVVRDVAAQLGGEVSLETTPGRGSSFSLEVPLSLSALDALLVQVDGVFAALPLAAVRGTVRLTKAEVAETAEGQTVVHGGQVIPFVPLSRPLGGRADPVWLSGGRSAVVVAASADARAALGVDRLLGTANLVLRPLPAFAAADPVVAGAAIDATGTPQLILDPDELVAAARRPRRAAPEPAAEAAAPILVVDDSLTTRMLEQSILESAGYEVELATSAEEGLDKARRRRYRLFLVDVEMPGMDGFAFVATSRADPALRGIPAILVTSRAAPEDRRRGLEAGASGYVVKGDFDQGRLLTLIRKLVA